MELSHNNPVDIHINKGKSLESLTPIEQQQFVANAIAEKDKFVTWAKKQNVLDAQKSSTFGSKISESWKNDPSKKLLATTLSAVGLSLVGLTIAGEKAGISHDELWGLWKGSFGQPILEELVFRSRKIPQFLSWINSKHGTPMRDDKARLVSDVLFGFGHTMKSGLISKKTLSGLSTFGAAGFYQKLANERGLGTAIAAHAAWDTALQGSVYLIKLYGNKIPEAKVRFVRDAYIATLIGTILTKGIIGIKEMIDDKKISNLLATLRTTSDGKIISDQNEINSMANKLLKVPATDGYKFQAGVEMAYVNAALTMPDMLKDVMTPDEYARTQVHKMVTAVWKDPKTLPHRLEKANRYITEQITARNQPH